MVLLQVLYAPCILYHLWGAYGKDGGEFAQSEVHAIIGPIAVWPTLLREDLDHEIHERGRKARKTFVPFADVRDPRAPNCP